MYVFLQFHTIRNLEQPGSLFPSFRLTVGNWPGTEDCEEGKCPSTKSPRPIKFPEQTDRGKSLESRSEERRSRVWWSRLLLVFGNRLPPVDSTLDYSTLLFLAVESNEETWPNPKKTMTKTKTKTMTRLLLVFGNRVPPVDSTLWFFYAAQFCVKRTGNLLKAPHEYNWVQRPTRGWGDLDALWHSVKLVPDW